MNPMHPDWRKGRKVKLYNLPAGTRFLDRAGRTGTLLGMDETAWLRRRVAIDGRGTTYVSGELAVVPIEMGDSNGQS